MARLIAKHPFRYASRDLKAGEEFETEKDSDATVLRAAGHAGDPAGDDSDQHQGRRAAGRHNRRDMRAAD